MKNVALFVKSHRPDLFLVRRLLDSISTHTVSGAVRGCILHG
jgi:hypothetical protein